MVEEEARRSTNGPMKADRRHASDRETHTGPRDRPMSLHYVIGNNWVSPIVCNGKSGREA